MTSDLLAALSRSTPWTAGAQLSGFNRLSTKHRRLSQSQCSSVAHIWNQRVSAGFLPLFGLGGMLQKWNKSMLLRAVFGSVISDLVLIFLALSFCLPPSVVSCHCMSSLLSMLTCTQSGPFFMFFFRLFFHFRSHCGTSPLTIPHSNKLCLFLNFLN